MNYKALNIGYVCKKREDFKVVDKLPCFFLTALDVEGENGRTAVGEVFLVKCVVGMILKRRMVNLCNLGMVL